MLFLGPFMHFFDFMVRQSDSLSSHTLWCGIWLPFISSWKLDSIHVSPRFMASLFDVLFLVWLFTLVLVHPDPSSPQLHFVAQTRSLLIPVFT